MQLAAAADVGISEKAGEAGSEEQKLKEVEKLKQAMKTQDGKSKLYEVIKALSAMRLCKEDSKPSPILVRKKNADGTLSSEILPAPHPPKSPPTETAE